MVMSTGNNPNFIVHKLDQKLMPSGTEIIEESFRAEGMPQVKLPGWCGFQTSSLLIRLRFRNKILRIKQFLYDLGPSSTLGLGAFFDYYPWKIKIVALKENKPAWFGYDNKGRQPLGYLSHQTSIQISAEEGECEPEVFITIANALAPIPSSTSKAKSFAKSSYWSRFPRAYSYLTVSPDYAIPTSLWQARWPASARQAEVIWRDAKPHTTNEQWYLNSTYTKVFQKQIVENGELFLPLYQPAHQILYRRQIVQGMFSPKKTKSGKLPVLDVHSGFSAFRINVAAGEKYDYFIASCTNEHGPHDAIAWKKDKDCILVQASSKWEFSIAKFVRLLSEIQNENIILNEPGNLG